MKYRTRRLYLGDRGRNKVGCLRSRLAYWGGDGFADRERGVDTWRW